VVDRATHWNEHPGVAREPHGDRGGIGLAVRARARLRHGAGHDDGMGLLGLAPLSLAFAGFSSSSWFIALAALGIGAAMSRSGLFFRLVLFFLRILPTNYAAYVLGLLTGGLAVTPLVPVPFIRVATMTPLVHELAQALGYPARSRGASGPGGRRPHRIWLLRDDVSHRSRRELLADRSPGASR